MEKQTKSKNRSIKARLHDAARHVHAPSKRAIRMIAAVGLLFVVTTPLAFDYITEINDAITDTWRANRPRASSWNIPTSWTGYWYTSGDDQEWQTTETITKHEPSITRATLIVDVDEANIATAGITATIKKTDDTVLQDIPGIAMDDAILLDNLGTDPSFKITLSTKTGVTSIVVIPTVMYDSGETPITISSSGTVISFRSDSNGYLLLHGNAIGEPGIESLHVDWGDSVVEDPFADPENEKPLAAQMVAPRWWLVSFPYDWQSELHAITLTATISFNARVIAVTAGDVDGDKLSTFVEVINSVNADEQSQPLKPVVDQVDSWYSFESLGRSTSGVLADFDPMAGPVVGSILVHFASSIAASAVGLYVASDTFAVDGQGNDIIHLSDVNDDYTYDEKVQLDSSSGAAMFTPIGTALAGLYQLQFTVDGWYSNLCVKANDAEMMIVITGNEDIDSDGLSNLLEDGDLDGTQTPVFEFTSVINRDSDDDGLIDSKDVINGSETYNTGGTHHVARVQLDYPAGLWSNSTKGAATSTFTTESGGTTRVGRLTYLHASGSNASIKYEFSKRSPVPSASNQAIITWKMAWNVESTPLVEVAVMENQNVRCLVKNKDNNANLFAWDNSTWSTTASGSATPGTLVSLSIRFASSTTFYVRIGSGTESGPFTVKDGTAFSKGITHLSIKVSGMTCSFDIDEVDASWTSMIDENFQQREIGASLDGIRDSVVTYLDIGLSNTTSICTNMPDPWIPWGDHLFTIMPMLRVFGNTTTFTANPLTSTNVDGDIHVYKATDEELLMDETWSEDAVNSLPQPIGDRGDGVFLDYSLLPMNRMEMTGNFRASLELHPQDTNGTIITDWGENDNRFFFRFDVVYTVFMKENDGSLQLVQVYEYPDEFTVQSAIALFTPEVAYVQVNTTEKIQECVYAAYLLKYLSLVNGVTNTAITPVGGGSPIGDFADGDVHFVSYYEFKDIINTTLSFGEDGQTIIGVVFQGYENVIERNDIRNIIKDGAVEFTCVAIKFSLFCPVFDLYLSWLEAPNLAFGGQMSYSVITERQRYWFFTDENSQDYIIESFAGQRTKRIYKGIDCVQAFFNVLLGIWGLYLSYTGAQSEKIDEIQLVKQIKFIFTCASFLHSCLKLVQTFVPETCTNGILNWLGSDCFKSIGIILGGILDILELIADSMALKYAIESGDEILIAMLTCKVILGILQVALFGYIVAVAVAYLVSVLVVAVSVGFTITSGFVLSTLCAGLLTAAGSSAATVVGWIVTIALIVICIVFAIIGMQQYHDSYIEQFLSISHPEVDVGGNVTIVHGNTWQYGNRIGDNVSFSEMALSLWTHPNFDLADDNSGIFKYTNAYLKDDKSCGVYWDCQRNVIPYFSDDNEGDVVSFMENEQPLDLYRVTSFWQAAVNTIGGSRTSGSLPNRTISLTTTTPQLLVRDQLAFTGYLVEHQPQYYTAFFENAKNFMEENVYTMGPVFPENFTAFWETCLDHANDPGEIYPCTYDFNSYSTAANLPNGWSGDAPNVNFFGHNSALNVSGGSLTADVSFTSSTGSSWPDYDLGYPNGLLFQYSDPWYAELYPYSTLRGNGLLPEPASITAVGHASGFVEFWLYTTGVTTMEMRDGTGALVTTFSTDYVGWTDGGWHHVKIEFVSSGDIGGFHAWMWVDDKYTAYRTASCNYVGQLVFSPESPSTCYIDAIGCSWDPNYVVGSNKEPLVPQAIEFDHELELAISPATPVAGCQVPVYLDEQRFSAFDFDDCRTAGQDIRFFDAGGRSLPYWIERWDATNEEAIVWVKVLEAGTTAITMKYGNDTALSKSNGKAVFEFFDDFDDQRVDPDLWTCNVYVDLGEFNSQLWMRSSLDFAGVISNVPVAPAGTGGIVEMSWLPDEDTTFNIFQQIVSDSAWFGVYDNLGSADINAEYGNPTAHVLPGKTNTPPPANDPVITRLTRTPGDVFSARIVYNDYGYYGPDVPLIPENWDVDLSRLEPGDMKAYLSVNYGSTWCRYDWIRVRKYTAIQPIATAYSNTIELAPATPAGDLQVKVTLDSNFDFTRCKAYGDDIRFTDEDGSGLSYWIERWNAASEFATIWVKVKEAGTTSITMCYGNPVASSSSDGDATFEFFDDFIGSGFYTDEWIPSLHSYCVIEDSKLRYGSTYDWATIVTKDFVIHPDEGGVVEMAWHTSSPTADLLMDQRLIDASNPANAYGIYDSSSASTIWSYRYTSPDYTYYTSGGVATPFSTSALSISRITCSPGTPVKFSAGIYREDGSLHGPATLATWDCDDLVGIGDMKLQLNIHPNSQDMYYHWVRIRKQADVEPVASMPVMFTATTVADQQVEITLDSTFDYTKCPPNGYNVRFKDEDGNTIPHLIQRWNDVNNQSEIRLIVPDVGTTTANMFFTHPAAQPPNKDYQYDFWDFADGMQGWTATSGKHAIQAPPTLGYPFHVVKLWDDSSSSLSELSKSWINAAGTDFTAGRMTCGVGISWQGGNAIGYITLKQGSTAGPMIGMWGSYFYYYTATGWHAITSLTINHVYTLDIAFDLESSTFSITIDGKAFGPFAFYNALTAIDKISFSTGTTPGASPNSYTIFVGSVGYYCHDISQYESFESLVCGPINEQEGPLGTWTTSGGTSEDNRVALDSSNKVLEFEDTSPSQGYGSNAMLALDAPFTAVGSVVSFKVKHVAGGVSVIYQDGGQVNVQMYFATGGTVKYCNSAMELVVAGSLTWQAVYWEEYEIWFYSTSKSKFRQRILDDTPTWSSWTGELQNRDNWDSNGVSCSRVLLSSGSADMGHGLYDLFTTP
ncbi:MAG: DUF2341 domain-containing protein [Candidatus Lokiarchaeota archaeon]|nr:DUF2341 domain-containing protein [Candidatus Lokiarchaeota archaeon]